MAMQRPRLPMISVPHGSIRFWKRFGVVLGVILAMAVANVVVLERMSHEVDSGGAVMQLACHQRLLVRRLTQAAFAASDAHYHGDQNRFREAMEELRSMAEGLEDGHRKLRTQINEQTGEAANPTTTRRPQRLNTTLDALIQHASASDSGPSAQPHRLIESIDRYATELDGLVIGRVDESRNRVQAVRFAGRLAVIGKAIVIGLACLLVLRPAMHEARQDVRDFQEALRHLELERTAGNVLNDSLREALSLNRAVFSTAADSVIILNREGVIEQANPSAAETFHVPEEQLVGSRINNLMSESDADVHDEYLKHACESTADGVLLRNHNIRGRRSDGSYFPAELSVSKVQVAGRTVFTGILRDISERVQLESRLAQGRKMESVGQLASGIAHEINTPMQFIATNISYLNRQLTGLDEFLQGVNEARDESLAPQERTRRRQRLIDQLPDGLASADIRGAIDDSLVGVDRVVEIISAMKDFAHPGTESKGVVDINHVLETAAVIARNRTKQVAQVTLDLDECEEFPGVVSGLNQTFVNLLVNAADAIEESAGEHGPRGDIRVTSKRLDGGVEVLVSDTGCGMPEEVASHAFDPFYTTKDIGKGSGQGLTIAYNAVVEQHGGRITIESAPGAGTTFRIFLPIAEAADANTDRRDPVEQPVC